MGQETAIHFFIFILNVYANSSIKDKDMRRQDKPSGRNNFKSHLESR